MFIQMVVLLYIPASIIHGLGSTRPTVARTLFRKGWLFLTFIWGLVIAAVYLMNFLFPRINVIFSGREVHSSFEQNFLSYLVPENPLYDIVNNIVPAIAIFAIIIGVAVMHLTHKEPLISLLERVNNTLEQVLKGIMIVSPIGVLAIFANFVGNVEIADILRVKFYIIPMVVIALVLTFWTFPALIMSATPLKYHDVIKDIRSSCFLAFVIGSPSIAIPFLYRTVQHYAERFEIKDKELHNTSQMIVPIAYTFTQVGNLFILFFIMFLSYYFRHQLAGLEELLVSFMTLLMSFGGPELALNSVTFLSDSLGFPAASLDLYDTASIFTQNFQILISVASMVTFVTLLLLAYYKRLTFKKAVFFRHFAAFFILLGLTVFGAKYLIQQESPKEDPFDKMTIQTTYPIAQDAKVYKIGDKLPTRQGGISDTLERIYATKTLHVGYHPHLPPFSYFNDQGELVGFNITFAHKLAYDMNVNLVFLPFAYQNLPPSLTSGYVDIAMAPVLLSEGTVGGMSFSHYYLTTPNVLIVPRSKKDNFLNFEDLKKNRHLTIGVPGFYKEILKQILPEAENVQLTRLEEISSLLQSGKVDAVIWTREEGIGYCRSHLDYVVIDYGDQAGTSYLAYPIKYNAFAFLFFLNRWLTIQENSGFKEEQYGYWMGGRPPLKPEGRWSLIRDVFGWSSE